jgi:hypothetical protein
MLKWFAQNPDGIKPSDIGLTNPQTNADLAIGTILDAVYLLAGIVSVIIIVIAGYYYTTSSGDAAGTKRAKQAIIGSCVGLVVILMAFTITQFILGRF